MRVAIVVVKGPWPDQRIEFDLEQFYVGSKPSSPDRIQIPEDSISSEHVYFYLKDGQLMGRDLTGRGIIENSCRHAGDFPVFSGRVYELSPSIHIKIEWGEMAVAQNAPVEEKTGLRQWKIRGVLQFTGAVIIAQTAGLSGDWESEDIGERAVAWSHALGVLIFASSYLFQNLLKDLLTSHCAPFVSLYSLLVLCF